MAAVPPFAASQTAPELPAFDLRALARRAALPLGLGAIAAAVVVAAGGPLQAFADALGRALEADTRWVGAAAVFELLSFAGYIALLWLVGSRATARMGLRASVHVTLAGAAATRLLPTGGVGGAALTLWSLRRAGLGARAAARTLLAFLVVVYAVFFSAIATAGGLLALDLVPGDGPVALAALPAAGAALVILGSLALAARHRRVAEPGPGGSRARAALRHLPDTYGGAVRDAIALVRGADPRMLGAPAWWAFDAAVLWAMLNAFGASPPLAVVALAYFVGQLANSIPIPGAVSGGTVGVMLAFGVDADLALVSVLAYRALAIWLPATVGLAGIGGLRTIFAGWAADDAGAGGR